MWKNILTKILFVISGLFLLRFLANSFSFKTKNDKKKLYENIDEQQDEIETIQTNTQDRIEKEINIIDQKIQKEQEYMTKIEKRRNEYLTQNQQMLKDLGFYPVDKGEEKI